ncbi:odorant receptor 13a-like [Neodiprion pinetum]|uniref:odorant receptor 13a-like n=1 Tax=Neodiprion pinetum TaxID=441929 RepID=UPI001EDE9E48|nr:odorant receptor 22c-like [Neodiprion pinetum]
MLTPFGMWPKDKHDLRFAVSFVYMAVHVGMECADFTRHMGDLQNLLDNLSETTIYMILFAKVIVFHKNRILAQMIDAMNEDRTDFKNNRSIDEQRLYAAYNAMAKTFFKILVPLVFSTAILYYLRPLAGLIFSKVHNGKTPYVLPYRTRYSFEITEVYTYVLAYLYQGGTLPLVTVGLIGSDGLFITLMLHICGELSILSSKIAALKEDKANFQHSGIRSIVKRHTRLMWMAEKMDKAFTIVLLGQLFGSSLLICLNGFNVIVNSERVQRTSLITFAFYEASMLTFLYAYCFIGECLIQERSLLRMRLVRYTTTSGEGSHPMHGQSSAASLLDCWKNLRFFFGEFHPNYQNNNSVSFRVEDFNVIRWITRLFAITCEIVPVARFSLHKAKSPAIYCNRVNCPDDFILDQTQRRPKII